MVSELRAMRRKLIGKLTKRSVRAPELERTVGDLARVLSAQEKLLKEQSKLLFDLRWEAQQNRKYQNAIWLSATRGICDEVDAFVAAHQLGLMETVERIASTGESFARFGDGELRLMLRHSYQLKFQKNSPALRSSLQKVLKSPHPSVLLGFPSVYRDLHGSAVWSDIWPQVAPLVEGKQTFGNSHVSRPLFFQQYGSDGVDAWRAVWENQDVCVITGRDSRFEAVPALFSSARSVRAVESLAMNAFDDIERLLDPGVLGSADVFLISLGPAGTVLADRLAAVGHRALDVGHISDSYLNVFEGGAWPESKPATRS